MKKTVVATSNRTGRKRSPLGSLEATRLLRYFQLPTVSEKPQTWLISSPISSGGRKIVISTIPSSKTGLTQNVYVSLLTQSLSKKLDRYIVRSRSGGRAGSTRLSKAGKTTTANIKPVMGSYWTSCLTTRTSSNSKGSRSGASSLMNHP